MSIELASVLPRHERRLRLVFTNNLDTGAFGLNPTLYVVTAIDALGATPGIAAALIVPGATADVELALDTDLRQGARYHVTAIGVPASGGGGTSTTASASDFVFGATPARQDVEPIVDETERILYGSDLIWSGPDFQLTAAGDLARVSGVTNAISALTRAMFAEGLPWDQTYGAHPRSYVDIPESAIGTLRTSLLNAAVADDRVKSATVEFLPDADEPEFSVAVKLIGDHAPDPISVTVPS